MSLEASSSPPFEPVKSNRRRIPSAPLAAGQSFYEWTALSLLLASSAGGMWLFGGVRVWLAAPLLTLTFFGVLMAVARPFVFTSSPPWRIPLGSLVLLAPITWAGISILYSSVPYDGVLEWIQYLSVIGAYWAWCQLAGRQDRRRWLILILILAATFMALYALIQEFRHSRLVLIFERMPGYGDRASGAYFCPNHFANILEIFIPVCFALLVCRSAGFTLRLFSGYALAVMFPALYLTQSRSGWMAVLAGLTVTICAWAWRSSRRRFVWTLLIAPFAIAGAAVGAYAALPLVRQRVDIAFQGNMRINLWLDTLDMIRQHPLVGFGLGSYRWRYAAWQTHYREHMTPIFAHNEWLQTWADTGIVGLVLVLICVLFVGARLLRAIRSAERDRDAFLVMGFAGAFAGCLVHSSFDYNFHLYANNHVLAALLGLTVCDLRGLNSVATKPRPRWALLSASCLAVLAAISAITIYIRCAVSDGLYLYGEKKRENFDFVSAEAMYRKAARWKSDYWKPYLGLGELRSRQSFWNRVPGDREKQFEESLDYLGRARKLNPWDLKSGYAMYKIYRQRGENPEALEVIGDLVARGPGHARYQLEYGESLLIAGRKDEALQAFRRSLAIQFSEDAQAYIQELEAGT